MENINQRPVGVFDSGLGGLSVLREALCQLPRENYIYFGDNLNAPYGDKGEAEITRLAFAGARLLVERGVKALVVHAWLPLWLASGDDCSVNVSHATGLTKRPDGAGSARNRRRARTT